MLSGVGVSSGSDTFRGGLSLEMEGGRGCGQMPAHLMDQVLERCGPSDEQIIVLLKG